jgi:flagellar protein FlgJ
MADPVSLPKLPVNLSQVMTDDPTRLLRALSKKKGTAGGSANDPDLVETCHQMESLFIHHLFKEMRATIQRSGFISGGRAEEIYTSMMDAEMAAKLSERGGIGLAELLLHQLGKPASGSATGDSGEAE